MKHHKNLYCAAGALAVLAVFAMGILGTLLGGVGIYRRLTQRDRASFDSRTCVQYMATRVRQADGAVETGIFGEGDALLVAQPAQDGDYLTRIYCYDGWMMELFSARSADLAPQDGEKILPARELTLELEDGLLRVRVTDMDGAVHDLYLYLRHGEVLP